jgi:serine/threonine protein kinase
LKYLDNKGVSHRDLKPQNIMISDDLNIKLIDFGLANDKQSYRNKCGTLAYMAPEMHIRKEYIGQPADMWASGCILFYILTGKIPFRAIREADLIKLVRRKLKFSFDLPEDSVKLISNLLDQDTCSRYTAEEALMHSWFL